jgi:two-component system, NarL family, nitrate/nitrite response regulator NarL
MSWKVFNILETSFDSNSADVQAPGSTSQPTATARGIGLVLGGHHPLTLCGLSQVFEKEGDCTVLAVCTDAEAVLEAVRRHQPDILILDLDRHGAFKILRRVQRERLATRVVVLAAASDDNEMVDAVRLGARAVVLKELPPEAFVACIRKVHGGERSPDGDGNGALVSKLFKGGTSMRYVARQLTPREAEIARLAVLGISTRDIASRLDVKQGTVKIHLHSIYEKLNVGGRLGLILFARRHGLA